MTDITMTFDHHGGGRITIDGRGIDTPLRGITVQLPGPGRPPEADLHINSNTTQQAAQETRDLFNDLGWTTHLNP